MSRLELTNVVLSKSIDGNDVEKVWCFVSMYINIYSTSSTYFNVALCISVALDSLNIVMKVPTSLALQVLVFACCLTRVLSYTFHQRSIVYRTLTTHTNLSLYTGIRVFIP